MAIKKRNRICHVCGNEYSYCPNCDKDRLKPSWYALFCSDQCHEIDGILTDYNHGKTTASKARKALMAVGADTLDIKDEDIKAVIAGILGKQNEAEAEEAVISE